MTQPTTDRILELMREKPRAARDIAKIFTEEGYQGREWTPAQVASFINYLQRKNRVVRTGAVKLPDCIHLVTLYGVSP